MALSFGSFEGGLDQKKKELLQRLANKRKVNRSGGTGSGRFGQSGMFGRGLQRGGANNALQGIAARLGGYGGSSMGAQNMFQGYPEPPAQANQQFDLGYLSQPQYQEPQYEEAPAPQYETPQQLIDTTLGPQQTPFLTPEIMNTISPQTPFYGNDPAIQQFINPEPTPFYGNDSALQPYVDLGSQQPAYDTTALSNSSVRYCLLDYSRWNRGHQDVSTLMTPLFPCVSTYGSSMPTRIIVRFRVPVAPSLSAHTYRLFRC